MLYTIPHIYIYIYIYTYTYAFFSGMLPQPQPRSLGLVEKWVAAVRLAQALGPVGTTEGISIGDGPHL